MQNLNEADDKKKFEAKQKELGATAYEIMPGRPDEANTKALNQYADQIRRGVYKVIEGNPFKGISTVVYKGIDPKLKFKK